MQKKYLILSTGFAMFSMFFGSGNLVFPLMVGQSAGGHFPLATLGILLTGVLVPFLGIWAMLLFNGKSEDFFAQLGKPATFWFPLIALSLMGPFGVLARCITVAHGAFQLLWAHTPLWLFSLLFCGLIFVLTLRKNRIIPLLGSILTPLLLLALGAIAFLGIRSLQDTPLVLQGPSAWESFKNGILQGYQTMDLLAAFFFSTFVLQHLRDRKADSRVFIRSALLGAGLLSAVYFVLVLLGGIYAPILEGVPPQEMLGSIAQKALGPLAAPVVCLAIALACLTTAVVLTSLFAEFLKTRIAKEKISLPSALLTTLMIAFVTSTMQFSGISKVLGPILETTYPALIVFTVLGIFHKLWGWSAIRLPFLVAFCLKLLSRTL